MLKRKSLYRQLGDEAEETVRLYLEEKGYQFMESRFQTQWGEIDLIMTHQGALVFVEVKFRRGHDYGYPAEAVTKSKQERMVKTALDYIRKNNLGHHQLRFDVVALGPNGLKHYPNAFWAESEYYY